ncbi:MAG: hypothetical protein ACI8WB_000604 [Phenylobacterium sp.]|jgi:hypothetical protein
MPRLIKEKWYVFLWINILWILGTTSIGYSTYVGTIPAGSTNTIETIKIVFLALGGLGIILPTYINATNTIEGRHYQILENTYNLIEKWDDPQLFEARKLIRDLIERKSQLSDDELLDKIEKDALLKQSFILVLNYFEQVRFSININRIDVAMYKNSMGKVAKKTCGFFRPYLETRGSNALADWDELVTLLS